MCGRGRARAVWISCKIVLRSAFLLLFFKNSKLLEKKFGFWKFAAQKGLFSTTWFFDLPALTFDSVLPSAEVSDFFLPASVVLVVYLPHDKISGPQRLLRALKQFLKTYHWFHFFAARKQSKSRYELYTKAALTQCTNYTIQIPWNYSFFCKNRILGMLFVLFIANEPELINVRQGGSMESLF